MLDQAINRQGRVVCVSGPPGIGKSRIAQEAAAIADGRGIEVIATYLRVALQRDPVSCGAGLFAGSSGLAGWTPQREGASAHDPA